jgi:hypothetical protein
MSLTDLFAEARTSMDAHKGNYFWEPIPIPLDAVLQRFVRDFMTADDANRAQVLQQLTPRYRQLLESFGIRSATLGARNQNPDLITEGLIALRLGWPADDVREQIMHLAPMHHAALMAGGDPAEIFRMAAAVARDSDFSSFLEEFLSRPDDEKSLKALGFREVTHADGLRFEPGGDW